MFGKLRQVPARARIVIGCLGVLLVCASVYFLHRIENKKRQDELINCCAPPPAYLERLEKLDKLKKGQAEYAQLRTEVSQCQIQMEEALSKQAERKYVQPGCVATMRQWLTRGAQLEAEIQRLQSSLETGGQQSSQPANEINAETYPR